MRGDRAGSGGHTGSDGAGQRGLSLCILSPLPAAEQRLQGAWQRGTYGMARHARSVSGGALLSQDSCSPKRSPLLRCVRVGF